MPENNSRKPDKSATVHIDAGTMEKLERYHSTGYVNCLARSMEDITTWL